MRKTHGRSVPDPVDQEIGCIGEKIRIELILPQVEGKVFFCEKESEYQQIINREQTQGPAHHKILYHNDPWNIGLAIISL